MRTTATSPAALALAALFLTGCAVPPAQRAPSPAAPATNRVTPSAAPAPSAPTAAPPRTERFVALPSGTRLSYLRHDVGSYGRGETRMDVTVGDSTWRGRRAIAFTRAQSTTDLQEPETHKLLAVMNPNGQAVVTYNPPIGYDLPLTIGKSWTTRSEATTAGSPQVTPIEVRYTVQTQETITVPAGTFKAWRLHLADLNAGDEQRVWIAMDTGLALKRSYRRTSSHAQGIGAREIELVSIETPR